MARKHKIAGITQCRMQRIVSKRNQICAAGSGNEARRRNQTVLRVPNACETLGSHHVPTSEVEFWLVPKFNPILVQGLAKIDRRPAGDGEMLNSLFRSDDRGRCRAKPKSFLLDNLPDCRDVKRLGAVSYTHLTLPTIYSV